MIKKTLTILIVSSLFILDSFCQQKGNKIRAPRLLYLVEAKTNYLIPYIEYKLKNLRAFNKRDLLFSNVASFNSMFDLTSTEATLWGKIIQFEHLENLNVILADNGRQGQLIADEIRRSQLVLKIKVNTFKELIEFQFSLYKVKSKSSGGMPLLEYDRSSGIFLNPRDENYDKELLYALKQTFVDAHSPPQYEMKVNKTKVNGAYFCSPEDTLIIEPIMLRQEAKESDLTYNWTDASQPTTSSHLALDGVQRVQKFIKPRPGTNVLHFKVADGISDSRTDTLNIEVIPRPNLFVYTKRNSSYYHNIYVQNYVWSPRQTVYFPFLYIRSKIHKSAKDSAVLHSSLIDGSDQTVFAQSNTYTSNLVRLRILKEDLATVHYRVVAARESDTTKTDSIDLNQEIDFLHGGRHTLKLTSEFNGLKSTTVNYDIVVKERAAIAFYANYLFFPFSRARLLSSWLNYEMGARIALSENFRLNLAPGISVFNKNKNRFFGNAGVEIKTPGYPFQGEYSFLVYSNPQVNRTQSALGLTMAYSIERSNISFRIGPAAYYSFHRYLDNKTRMAWGINYGGSFLLSKKNKRII